MNTMKVAKVFFMEYRQSIRSGQRALKAISEGYDVSKPNKELIKLVEGNFFKRIAERFKFVKNGLKEVPEDLKKIKDSYPTPELQNDYIKATLKHGKLRKYFDKFDNSRFMNEKEAKMYEELGELEKKLYA